MDQRGILDQIEILHYLQLSDLLDLIRGNWSFFAPRTKLRRREFNDLVAAILKGRTEEAHNRPEHLWPEIERQRVRVACYDLLAAFALG
jgi:hypothetical protein